MSTYDDAVWEAWRSGRNPDRVDADRIWYDEAQGYEPEECITRELRRIAPQPEPRDYAARDEHVDALRGPLDAQPNYDPVAAIAYAQEMGLPTEFDPAADNGEVTLPWSKRVLETGRLMPDAQTPKNLAALLDYQNKIIADLRRQITSPSYDSVHSNMVHYQGETDRLVKANADLRRQLAEAKTWGNRQMMGKQRETERAETAEAELKRINPLYTAACIGQRDAEAALAAERAKLEQATADYLRVTKELHAERAAREVAIKDYQLRLERVEFDLKEAERERDAAADLAREECIAVCRAHRYAATILDGRKMVAYTDDLESIIRSTITDPSAVKRTMENADRYVAWRNAKIKNPAIVWGPEKQDAPGGPIYRVGTSTGVSLPSQPEAQCQPARSDHPARHWDRTCPACNPVPESEERKP